MQAQELERLVPHRQGMLLLRDVLAVDRKQVEARAIVSSQWPCVLGGVAPPVLLLEILAQTVAVHYGAKRQKDGGAALGFLVGIKEASLDFRPLTLGEPIIATAEPVSMVNNYGVFQGRLRGEGSDRGRAVLQVLEQELGEEGFSLPRASLQPEASIPLEGLRPDQLDSLRRFGGLVEQITQNTQGSLKARISFPSWSPWFSGHFPQVPILPGVAMLNTVCQLAPRLLDRPGQELGRVGFKRVKFTSLTPPGRSLRANLELRKGSIQFALSGLEGPACKGLLSLGEPG